MKTKNKTISLLLSILMLLYSVLPYGMVLSVYAQEVDPSPSAESSPSTEPSPSPIADPDPSPTDTPSPTPTPVSTMSPDEYDEWKIQKNLEDDAREVREDEWEAHEEDDAWTQSHGGNEEYYVSGNWQKDEDARIAAEKLAEQEAAAAAAAAAAMVDSQFSNTFLPSEGVEYDPCSPEDSLAASLGGDTAAVSNTNCLVLGNSDTASGISGQNDQVFNDGPVDMLTGESSGTGTMVNTGNVNVTGASLSEESLSADSGGDVLGFGSVAENLDAGGDLENLSEISNSESLGVVNSNEAYVNNELNVQGTSGQNIVAGNDGEATLTTGDIELIANMLNILNINITGEDFIHLIINIFGTLNVDLDINEIALALGLESNADLQIIAQNADSSVDSDSVENTVNSEETSIDNNNVAVVNNTMNVDGVSGQNDVSGNDGDVDVMTGRIMILANLMNFINANFSGEKWSFIMVNIFGSLVGDIVLPDTSDYTNDVDESPNVTATSSEGTDVTNTNGVSLTNDISVNGVSGDNTQNGNDEGDIVNSGEVDIVTKLVNYLNYNITGNNWVFLVVNVFGKWMGKIVNFAGTDMDAPEDGSFAALSVGQSSGEAASVTNTETTDVNNNNSAVVNNDLNINGISGENGVNGNDGITSLTTGWVDIDVNLLNIINMNVTGRSWMIVFLNIFGNFDGNLFFGDKPEVKTEAKVQEENRETNDYQEPDFSMGDSSIAVTENEKAAEASVLTISATQRNRLIHNTFSEPTINNFVYYSDFKASPVNEDIFFYLFGKRFKIPSVLVKLFSRLALKGNLLLARS